MSRGAAWLGLIALVLAAAPLAALEEESRLDAGYWWDQFIKFFNVALVIGALYFLLRKPVRNFFAERARQIDESLEAAKATRAEAERCLAEVKEKVAGLRREVEEIQRRAEEEGEAEKVRIVAAAEREAERIVAGAGREVENRFRAARQELKAYAAELAVERARELLGERLGDEVDRRLVDRYLDEMGEVQ